MPTYDGEDVRRRLPSVPRNVSGISQSDVRVSVTGTLIDASENGIVLDDGTGRISVSIENKPGIRTGQLVRVLGRVMAAEGGPELSGEIVQDMTGLDLSLRRRAEGVIRNG
ncbi:MAG: replication protein RepA [Candidatus Aenigmarchaeota archaeon]|nr:replication protein RepA [Candidatus Aenigmarchaeota archaeon]